MGVCFNSEHGTGLAAADDPASADIGKDHPMGYPPLETGINPKPMYMVIRCEICAMPLWRYTANEVYPSVETSRN